MLFCLQSRFWDFCSKFRRDNQKLYFLCKARFCLNSLVCRSVINGTSVPNDYPISTGKNSRRYRQD